MHRNYVTQDIIRRILTDYFGYHVHFVMNITDIDDKVRTRIHRHIAYAKVCIYSDNSKITRNASSRQVQRSSHFFD